MTTILVTGIAGSLARLAAMALMQRGHDVVGADYRPKPAGFPPDIPFHQANYNKTGIADVFRRHQPSQVLHLGRVGNLRVRPNRRFDLNVVGSRKIHDLALEYGVQRMVVLSTFHIYGAHPHNHIPILEDEPVRALQTVPQLTDAVQLDTQAVTAAYRHPSLPMVVLRPTNVIGPHVNNTVSSFLRLRRIPYVLGFNPMWQFIHEHDILRALLMALEGDKRGVYNVAGGSSIPVVDAFRMTGRPVIGIPGAVVGAYRRFVIGGRNTIPPYLLDFLKYPVIVDDGRFRADFGYAPTVSVEDAIRTTVTRMPHGS